MKKTLSVLLALCLSVVTAQAIDAPPDIRGQAKGAKRVVVATVTDVDSRFGENQYGDRVIFTHVTLRVDETMKGAHEGSVVVTIEGGTVGDVTLTVSDMPQMVRGERAVLFLDESNRGGSVPHGRGAGVLKLDAEDRVAGTALALENVRATVKAAQK